MALVLEGGEVGVEFGSGEVGGSVGGVHAGYCLEGARHGIVGDGIELC